ncbi:MAG TPA: cation transporter [Armatimonadota bacterium]
MKKTLYVTLTGLLLLAGAALWAASAPKPVKPVTTAVTVAVDGFTCPMCPDGLQKDLAKLPGVSHVKATLDPAQVTATLDETKTTVSKLVAAISAHPQAMDVKKTYTGHLVAQIDTTMCAKNAKMCDGCFVEIPKVLKKIAGVSDVALDANGKVAYIGFAPGATVTTKAISKALAASDYHFTTRFNVPVPQAATAPSAAAEKCMSCEDR